MSSHTSSSSSSSSSKTVKQSRKHNDKILPMNTSQIAELDRFMGNVDAAKGRKPSSYSAYSNVKPDEKKYIVPYVPLNGSAPSGTRSLGYDGAIHPMIPSNGTRVQELGQGATVPYFRDENGTLWASQEEMDEYAALIEASDKRKKVPRPLNTTGEEWTRFSTTSSSAESRSPLSAASSRDGDTFDLNYDEAVMIPEGGAVGKLPTYGRLASAPGMMPVSTRGVESFPIPSGPLAEAGAVAPRPRGADRRRPLPPPMAEVPTSIAASTSKSSLGTIHPPPSPLDLQGKHEFLAESFAPSPRPSPTSPFRLPNATPMYNTGPPVSDTSMQSTPKARHRHSTSLAINSAQFFANLSAADKGMAPPSPAYMQPMGEPGTYNGIRQSSFSGPSSSSGGGNGGFKGPSLMSLALRRPSTHEKDMKKKASSGRMAGMFKKLGGKS
ncbi:hypothetical protein FRC02_004653 [Tulasnella sp. 418]|nr:hypothetical protein FRC02_004653 [Tulasnella sp. 418]